MSGAAETMGDEAFAWHGARQKQAVYRARSSGESRADVFAVS
jgi:hypothetical protein